MGDTTTLTINLFGPVRIGRIGHQHVLTGNTAALLGYLALHPYALPRSQVAGMLFPDVSEEQARRFWTSYVLDVRRRC